MASRQSMMPSRNNLTLTEELEKLEQSITLTLQEIDHNFSRAHRIVTSRIIPVVEQYARHSDAVWEGSKFWKEFFEASANVSLSGYEEAPDQDDTADLTQTTEGQEKYDERLMGAEDDSTITGERPIPHYGDDADDITIPDSPSLTIGANQATPKGRPGTARKTNGGPSRAEAFAEYPSPYETLKQDLEGGGQSKGRVKRPEPTTPGRDIGVLSDTPRRPSPFVSAKKDIKVRPNADPLLHRILDKNYRVQATPHAAQKKPGGQNKTTAAAAKPNTALGSSPLSSPMAAPQLRAEIFGTPGRNGPRTPGVSVQKGKARTPFSSHKKDGDETRYAWESDSETSDSLGLSPPKTMQFHIPQSRLLQTPAREASKRIVEDLLATAGGESITDELSELGMDNRYSDDEIDLGDDSPSIVRPAREELDGDSF